MSVIILIVVIGILGGFACSQPKRGGTFSARRRKFNKGCLYSLIAICAFSALFMLYNAFFATKCDDYDIVTDVYAIELKTSGHRMFSFMETIESKTLYGEEASELMEDIFGDTTDGRMLPWNSTPDWQGKYTAKVYYTEHDYELAKAGKSPDKIQRNDPNEGYMYRFTICEDGNVYCSMVNTEEPMFKVKMSWGMRKQLFPW